MKTMVQLLSLVFLFSLTDGHMAMAKKSDKKSKKSKVKKVNKVKEAKKGVSLADCAKGEKSPIAKFVAKLEKGQDGLGLFDMKNANTRAVLAFAHTKGTQTPISDLQVESLLRVQDKFNKKRKNKKHKDGVRSIEIAQVLETISTADTLDGLCIQKGEKVKLKSIHKYVQKNYEKISQAVKPEAAPVEFKAACLQDAVQATDSGKKKILSFDTKLRRSNKARALIQGAIEYQRLVEAQRAGTYAAVSLNSDAVNSFLSFAKKVRADYKIRLVSKKRKTEAFKRALTTESIADLVIKKNDSSICKDGSALKISKIKKEVVAVIKTNLKDKNKKDKSKKEKKKKGKKANKA